MRRKSDPTLYYAQPILSDGLILLAGGIRRSGHAGDVRITNEAGEAIDVISADLLTEFYEDVKSDAFALTPDQITRCAKVLRFGATKSAEEFTQAVESMAKVAIGGVKVEWTPGQIDQLKHRASKRGVSVQAYIQSLVEKFMQDIWTLG